MDMQAPEASADIGAGFRRIAVARAQPLRARQPCPDVAVGEAVQALISGLLSSPAWHLASHAQPYLASPASMLDLRDGGWDAIAGALAGTAWQAWRGWRMPPFRRPLVVAARPGCWCGPRACFTGARDAATMPMTALSTLGGGHPVDLRTAAAGRPVVVNLSASWCGPCRQELPTLAEAQRREGTVGFLFVNQGESESVIRAYLAGLGLPLREVLLDPGSAARSSRRLAGSAHHAVLRCKGSLADAHFGVLNPAALETRLQSLRSTGRRLAHMITRHPHDV